MFICALERSGRDKKNVSRRAAEITEKDQFWAMPKKGMLLSLTIQCQINKISNIQPKCYIVASRSVIMKKYTAVIERCPKTNLFVGYIPGFPGAHSQGETLDELNRNLKEVVEMLLEDGDPTINGEFIGTQLVEVA